MKIVSCHTISTTEDDASPSNSMEVTPKPEDFLFLGYVREQKLNKILIDNGSTVNILLKSTMNQLGISIGELSNSKLVIQGFNQGVQRAIGTVHLEIAIGDL
ncbi:uncharacterized protein E5676_scaffold280G00100 [Cucumis melo var. makuwa]|uniref:Ty3-gypsy retrotransposon protein n=1 Tax=Cucumis melo var. makuwa TaxID=1194695 RepID=A0A5D3BWK2_CUCMM|nr:uncharacterized protein E6C27_scaffold243G001690 [Cucumis melo var. makuwa]TYK02606.1 uncharacterized protein E5676_scaffold280G00100 [Cucumis melo var. makuwa]